MSNANKITKLWTKPNAGWIKVNVDASFLEDTNCAWVGFVARNDLGQVIIAGARQIKKCLSAEEAETRACVVGLQAIARVTQNPVFLGLDNASVVATIKNSSQYRGALWRNYEDVFSLRTSFQISKLAT
jgi:ribonuclease HI